ncbi:MAG: peptide ABC transporter substrate-binding protein [Chloroflexia bacterium]|nr:peptide ABC transporter substrate-binding protein [Chloroflexia bacterium]
MTVLSALVSPRASAAGTTCRAHWSILAAFVLICSLVMPLLTASARAQDDANVLRVHHASYPDVVDPQKSSTTPEIDILQLVYEGLTRLDANQETVPGAAESWEYNDDATQITFKLRPGLTYSDGSPLTAENFRYAVERTCDPGTAGEYQYLLFEVKGCADLAGLAADADGNPKEFTPAEHDAAVASLGVKAVDDLTLQIDLTNPAPYFHTIAALWVFFPVKQEIAAKDPDNWWKKAENHLGNGPFTVTGVEEGQEWTFAANDNYWQGRPRLDGIVYRYVDEAAVALEAYRAGDLDIVQLGSDQILEVEADPELAQAFVTYPQAGTQFLAMNLAQEPFNDKKVREAFAYAIDRETLCADLRSGDCLPTVSFIPAGLPGAIETGQYAFDPEAAKQALAESSYGGPDKLPEIKLYYNSDYEERGQQSEWIAGEIRDILGITLTLEPMEGAALTALRKDPKTHPQLLYFGSWYQDYPDPQNWLSAFWTCNSSLNTVGYCNEAFDTLTHSGDTTIDPAARLPFYQQAGQLLIDDVPAAFLLNPSGIFVVNPEVNGYTPTPSEVEWPGSVSSLMTIGKGEAPEAATLPQDAAAADAVVTEDAPVVEAEAAAVVGVFDADGDGLEDAFEAELGTDPYDVDTDDDGAADGDEYFVHQTGTLNPDNDADGVLDGDEVANGTDPNDPNSY